MRMFLALVHLSLLAGLYYYNFIKISEKIGPFNIFSGKGFIELQQLCVSLHLRGEAA